MLPNLFVLVLDMYRKILINKSLNIIKLIDTFPHKEYLQIGFELMELIKERGAINIDGKKHILWGINEFKVWDLSMEGILSKKKKKPVKLYFKNLFTHFLFLTEMMMELFDC